MPAYATISKSLLTTIRPSAAQKQSPMSLSRQTKPVSTGATQSGGSLVKMSDPIGRATVTCGSLNVRSGGDVSCSRIGGLTQGKTVEVYEEKDGWLKIGYGTGYGWICQKYTDYKSSTTTEPGPTTPEQPEQPGPTNDSFQIRVTGDSVYVRTGPSTDYEILGVAHAGDTFTATEVASNGWFKIDYNGQEGWISGKFSEKVDGSTPQPPATQDGQFEVVVSADTLNVRTGPSTDYGKIGSLTGGTKVTVLGESNGWYKIDYNGQEGWISGAYTYKPGESSAAGQKAVDHAYSLMNTCVNNNWHYDQNRRTQDGYYDCSAFTHRCWAAAGYSFGWANSEGQATRIYNKVGEISKSDVQPGDLLFYHHDWNSGQRWRGINHVAIAVGGGRRIDAGGEPVKNVGEIGDTVMIGRPSLLM